MTWRTSRRGWARLRSFLGRHHLDHCGVELAAWMALAAVLALGALAGIGWIAGYLRLGHILEGADWVWFPAALAGEALAYVGYAVAYREVARVENGQELRLPRLFALVANGFGVFIPHGGFAADRRILVDAGFHPQQARLRVLGLGALEYAILGPATCGAAIFLLVDGDDVPLSVTLPWAIAVPVGFVLAAAFLHRRERWHRRGGWREKAAHGLDVVAMLRCLARQPRDHGLAAGAGMSVYWLGDVFCLWACLRGFLGHPPSVAVLLVGYATGYALTRRALPFGGAGAVEALLPFALFWMGVPLGSAIVAVLAYRVFNLWLPLVPALAGRQSLRRDLASVDAAPLRRAAA